MLQDLTELTHQVGDPNYYQNYHQSDCHKMTDQVGDSPEEDSLAEEDSPVVAEDF